MEEIFGTERAGVDFRLTRMTPLWSIEEQGQALSLLREALVKVVDATGLQMRIEAFLLTAGVETDPQIH